MQIDFKKDLPPISSVDNKLIFLSSLFWVYFVSISFEIEFEMNRNKNSRQMERSRHTHTHTFRKETIQFESTQKWILWKISIFITWSIVRVVWTASQIRSLNRRWSVVDEINGSKIVGDEIRIFTELTRGQAEVWSKIWLQRKHSKIIKIIKKRFEDFIRGF